MNEWINAIPNEGLICYRLLLNKERLMITSPRALSEVLVQKNYEFVKPLKLRFGLGRILGVGLIVAEGDEHKVKSGSCFGGSHTEKTDATKTAIPGFHTSPCDGINHGCLVILCA